MSSVFPFNNLLLFSSNNFDLTFFYFPDSFRLLLSTIVPLSAGSDNLFSPRSFDVLFLSPPPRMFSHPEANLSSVFSIFVIRYFVFLLAFFPLFQTPLTHLFFFPPLCRLFLDPPRRGFFHPVRALSPDLPSPPPPSYLLSR